ncbi:MAG TPA: response regulator [Rhodospirillales bacterium]|jgi:DNA-binding response OmpR family regulator
MARILVIDDEELARFTLREILEASGHDVVEAANGNEGTMMQKATPCDMVITDMIMPDKEGLETIVELKTDNPNLKIIAISGGGRTKNLDFLNLAAEFGADKIIIKPFSEEELMEGVNACLAGA